jgi:ribosomal protein L14E/L6E/L27E
VWFGSEWHPHLQAGQARGETKETINVRIFSLEAREKHAMKQGALTQKTAEQSIKKGTREKIWFPNMKRLLARGFQLQGDTNL